MKKTNLSWVGALLVFALLLWCTAATPGKIDDPSTYTCAVYSSALSLLPPVVAIVLALNTKEVYTSLLVGIATGALLYANGNLELALTTLFFNEDGGMVSKLSDSSNVGILVFLVMLGILVALMNKAGGSAAFGRWASTHIHSRAGAHLRLKHPIPKNVANHDHGNFQSECQWPVCKNHDELILMGKNIGLILKSPNADLRFKHGVQLTLQILQHALPHA